MRGFSLVLLLAVLPLLFSHSVFAIYPVLRPRVPGLTLSVTIRPTAGEQNPEMINFEHQFGKSDPLIGQIVRMNAILAFLPDDHKNLYDHAKFSFYGIVAMMTVIRGSILGCFPDNPW